MAESIDFPQELIHFLSEEIVCCLGVPMSDGGVYVAPLRFWCDKDNLSIYMATARDSEKMWWLREGRQSISASIAIGLRDGLPYSIQMRGILGTLDHNTNEYVRGQYSKIASTLNDPNDPRNVMLVFYPTWARYTDRSTPEKITHMINF